MSIQGRERVSTFEGKPAEILGKTANGVYVARDVKEVSETCVILDVTGKVVGPATHIERHGKEMNVATPLKDGERYAEEILNSDRRLVLAGENGFVQGLIHIFTDNRFVRAFRGDNE